jgi:tRNA(Ile)-lysidine synthase
MEAIGAPWPAAVAVSGGSDSLALMLLLKAWAEARGLPPPLVASVDHGLRPESAREARQVVRWAKAAGLKAWVLTGEGPPPLRDIEAAARRLRYRLLGDFAKAHKLKAVYVAHTSDDQAETLLLRLARGSGVDGLAGMRALSPYPEPGFAPLALARPLLGLARQSLRDLLLARRQTWIDDPMNADTRFARVRIRLAWSGLAEIGLSPARLAETATHLGRARQALEAAAQAVLARACRPWCSDLGRKGLAVDPAALAAAPPELGLRALAGMLMAVSANPYRPRFDRLSALFSAITGGNLGGGRTLHGCRIGPAPKAGKLFGNGTLLIETEPGRQKTAGGKIRPQVERVFKRPVP